ncbi:MAG: hypothetical protein JSU63_10835 [Phycisphaerales bacterium]|nr:MAG: hypothetical protein JSU63_10835 [Phycisphaerales bacterium]
MNHPNRPQCDSGEDVLQECHDALDALESCLRRAEGLCRPSEPNPVDLVVKLRQKIICAGPTVLRSGKQTL